MGNTVNRNSRGQTARKVTASSYRNTKKKKSSRQTGTLMSSLVKALIFIVAIVVVSGFISVFAITRANDVFAFVKSGSDVTLNITGSETVDDIANLLADKGVIKYPSIYKLYVKIKKKTTVYKEGEYTVNPSMNYDKLNATLANIVSKERSTVVVYIPEGSTVKDVVDLLVNKYHLSTEEELYDAIDNADFDFWFVEALGKKKPERTFRLEGYLYPDTYYYYSDASASTIIYKMLSNFENKLKTTFGKTYREDIERLCTERQLTFDEIITIASMVQMEAKYDYEYGRVSSVFHNRINNPSVTYGLLGSDATIQYILEKRTAELTQEQLETDSPYNTRLYRGLPPGPISNPDYLAINYAFYPDTTSYYYFVSQKDGTSLFASTYSQHLENVRQVESGIIVNTDDVED
ncbi:MAG: endolytic transglycosylase MltG [Firmicutes bacterium]|nr:endolytic transglycosylase MltG [Candidatus Colimorpha enterica]